MSTSAADRTTSYREVLISRNVPQLLLSASLSRLASEMLLFTVVLYVLAEFRSPGLAGLSGFFLTLPGFLISPLAGALLDRVGALRAVIADSFISAGLIGLVVIASAAALLTAAVLLTLLALYSLSSPLSSGGIRSLFPRLVPDHAYDKANALDLSSHSAIEVIGPLAAGSLIATVGPQWSLGAVAAMYALSGISLFFLKVTGPGPEQPAKKHLLREAWAGLQYLFTNTSLRGLAASYSCYQVAFGILVVTVPVAVPRLLSGSGPHQQYTGAIWSMVGICGAVGALVAGRVVTAGRERAVLVGTMLLSSVAMYPVNAVASVIALVIGMALIGVLEGALNVSVLSLRQRRTAPEQLGRVMTVSVSVNLIGFPVGSALGGVLATHSVPLAFATAAGFTLVASLLGALLIPRRAT